MQINSHHANQHSETGDGMADGAGDAQRVATNGTTPSTPPTQRHPPPHARVSSTPHKYHGWPQRPTAPCDESRQGGATKATSAAVSQHQQATTMPITRAHHQGPSASASPTTNMHNTRVHEHTSSLPSGGAHSDGRACSGGRLGNDRRTAHRRRHLWNPAQHRRVEANATGVPARRPGRRDQLLDHRPWREV